jgi:hypothetical protein
MSASKRVVAGSGHCPDEAIVAMASFPNAAAKDGLDQPIDQLPTLLLGAKDLRVRVADAYVEVVVPDPRRESCGIIVGWGNRDYPRVWTAGPVVLHGCRISLACQAVDHQLVQPIVVLIGNPVRRISHASKAIRAACLYRT